MKVRLSAELQEAIVQAGRIASREGEDKISPRHLLSVLADQSPRTFDDTHHRILFTVPVILALKRAEHLASGDPENLVRRRHMLQALREVVTDLEGQRELDGIDTGLWADTPPAKALLRAKKLKRSSRASVRGEPGSS